jgi:hypothetical protein
VPLPTRAIEERTGYGPRYGQLVYRILNQLAAAGQVEKINTRRKPVYWRRLAPLPPVPTVTGLGDSGQYVRSSRRPDVRGVPAVAAHVVRLPGWRRRSGKRLRELDIEERRRKKDDHG